MKRFGLKALNEAGWIGSCMGAGWLFGRIFSILFKRIWTEEVKNTKPALFWTTAIFYYLLLAAFSIVWTTVLPIRKFFDFIDAKIDTYADEKEWD